MKYGARIVIREAAPEWQRKDRDAIESAATLGSHDKNMASLFELKTKKGRQKN